MQGGSLIDLALAAFAGGALVYTFVSGLLARAAADTAIATSKACAARCEELALRADGLEHRARDADRDVEMLCRNTGNRRVSK